MKNKSFIAVLFALCFSLPVFAADATVTYVKGKVEVSRNGEWVPLNVGDTVKQSETINTGFQSEARVKFNDSVMAIPALTRITLDNLSSSEAKDTVNLYVNTGAVRSKVTHTDNKKIDYTARTAVAVASVRGTDFTITAKGKVTCREGAVAVYSAKKYVAPSDEDAIDETEESEESEEATEAAETETSEVAESAAESEVSVESSESSDVPEGPATATTPANEISEDAPAGSVVVGAGQSTVITSSGNPETPTSDASQKSEKIKNQLSTQAEKSAETTDTPTGTTVTPPPAKPKKGSLVVSIELVD